MLALLKRPDTVQDRNKNIKVRRIAIKELIKGDEIKIHYLPTGEMLADAMTKPLQGTKFRMMRDALLHGAEFARGGASE